MPLVKILLPLIARDASVAVCVIGDVVRRMHAQSPWLVQKSITIWVATSQKWILFFVL